jgi:hypothetical protein
MDVAVCACKKRYVTPYTTERKSHEAETENTQSHGKAGQSNRIWQIPAPQSGNQPPATQQVT